MKLFKDHRKSINWLSLILEMLVVIIGILIAFGFDNMAEKNKQLKLEKVYLSSFRQDFKTDSAAFAYQIDRNLTHEKNVNRLIELIEAKDWSNDSLAYFARRFTLRNNYLPTTNTMDALLNSGKIDAIQSFDFYKNVNAHLSFASKECVLLRDETMRNIKELFQGYLIENSSYYLMERSGEWNDLDFLKDPDFLQRLIIWSDFLSYKISVYQTVHRNTAWLLELLDEILE